MLQPPPGHSSSAGPSPVLFRLHLPSGHDAMHAPEPLHSKAQPGPLQVWAQPFLPSQTQALPGLHEIALLSAGGASFLASLSLASAASANRMHGTMSQNL